jgi:hypothetical protein
MGCLTAVLATCAGTVHAENASLNQAADLATKPALEAGDTMDGRTRESSRTEAPVAGLERTAGANAKLLPRTVLAKGANFSIEEHRARPGVNNARVKSSGSSRTGSTRWEFLGGLAIAYLVWSALAGVVVGQYVVGFIVISELLAGLARG